MTNTTDARASVSPTAIRIVEAFQTLDGKRFHDLAEAKTHTRNERLMAIYKKLLQTDPKFARLDPDLFVAACVIQGRFIGLAATDEMIPVPAAPEPMTRAEYVQNRDAIDPRPGIATTQRPTEPQWAKDFVQSDPGTRAPEAAKSVVVEGKSLSAREMAERLARTSQGFTSKRDEMDQLEDDLAHILKEGNVG